MYLIVMGFKECDYDMKKARELIRFRNAMVRFQELWEEHLTDAFSECVDACTCDDCMNWYFDNFFDCLMPIYPFGLSFDEVDIPYWCECTIENIDNELEKIDKFKNEIINEVSQLAKEHGDNIGIELENGKGLWICVIDCSIEFNEEGIEYMIELNNVSEEDGWVPCARYNAYSPFGDMEKLIDVVEQYLYENGIEV